MPKVTVLYDLPEEQAAYDAARLGPQMSRLLWEIDQRCRTVVKYEQSPSEDRVSLAEEIRQMIFSECPDALDI
jgi:hypothetical protein